MPLEAGQGISDITANTEVVAIIIPNRAALATPRDYLLPGETSPLRINSWSRWQDWRVSINYLEGLTGYDFLSELPDQIEDAIESRGDRLLPNSASLLADENFASGLILNDIGDNFTIGQTGLSQITTTKFIDIDNSILEDASRKVCLAEESTSKISLVEPRVVHSHLSQDGVLEVSSFHRRVSDSSMAQVSPTENRTAQIDIFDNSIIQSRTTQVSPT